MQDNFVGDWGDFGKYSLLRVPTGLCPVRLSDDRSPHDRLSLGVVWYVPDDGTIARTSSGHGQDVGYLFDDGTREDWCGCDETLFNGLRSLVCGDRTLRALGSSGLIGPDDAFHYQSICLPVHLAEREVKRREWLEEALQRVRGQDLIFLDPDVGLADPQAANAPRELSPRSQDAPRYVYMWELQAPELVPAHPGHHNRRRTAEAAVTKLSLVAAGMTAGDDSGSTRCTRVQRPHRLARRNPLEQMAAEAQEGGVRLGV